MSSLIELLRETPSFLEISVNGLKKAMSNYLVDYTQGETDRSAIFVLPKEDLSWNEAFIILLQRQLMVEEMWLDLEEYNEEDLARWTDLLLSNYMNSPYETGILLDSDEDNAFFMKRLDSDIPRQIRYNDNPMSHEDFRQTCPLFTEQLLRVSKSKFNRLEVEYYIETENHYLLYNWYTTA